jgi:hypothetical protein
MNNEHPCNCENTYNAVAINLGMTQQEAREMVEYWRSPRLPHDFYREKYLKLQKDFEQYKKNVENDYTGGSCCE